MLAVLAYLGLLVFVPILSGSKSEFVRFHANQGLVLFICSVLWNACKSKKEELPFIGNIVLF